MEIKLKNQTMIRFLIVSILAVLTMLTLVITSKGSAPVANAETLKEHILVWDDMSEDFPYVYSYPDTVFHAPVNGEYQIRVEGYRIIKLWVVSNGFAEYQINDGDGNPNGTMYINYTFTLSRFKGAAFYVPNNYRLGANGWVKVTLSYVEYKEIPLPFAPVKEGHTFVGWYFDANFTEAYDGRTIYENTPLFAKYEVNSYTIYFDSDGGSPVSAVSREWNTTYSSLPTPTRNGYVFEGWYEGDVKVTRIVVKNNVYIKAKWSAITYKITYENLQNCINVNPTTYTSEDGLELVKPIRAGYNGSWNIASIPKGSTGDRVVTATWSIIAYTITYENLNNGTHTNPDTYTVESETINFSQPVADGAVGSWTIQNIPKGSTGDKVVTALWNVIVYNITYKNLQNGMHTNPATYTTVNGVSLTSPIRVGYNGSWDIVNIPAGSIGDKTITVEWSVITYTITYENLNGGTHTNPATYTVESDIINFSKPVKEGYTGSWNIESIPKGSTGNKTVTADWVVLKFNVKFTIGNDNYTVADVPYGSILATVIEEFATTKSFDFDIVGISPTETVKANTTIIGTVSASDKVVFSKTATITKPDEIPDNKTPDDTSTSFWEEYKIYIIIGAVVIFLGVCVLVGRKKAGG